MEKDVSGINRVICGFSKTPDIYGRYILQVEYQLRSIDLSLLQKLFNIDPNDSDKGIKDLIDCYTINKEQAITLQSYIIDGPIDIEKYDFFLQSYKK